MKQKKPTTFIGKPKKPIIFAGKPKKQITFTGKPKQEHLTEHVPSFPEVIEGMEKARRFNPDIFKK